MSRRGFTLIELLVVVALIGIMVAVGVVNVGAGKESMLLAGASRDVLSQIRRARSIALITQKPVLLTYENGRTADGEPLVRVTLKGEKLYKETSFSNPVLTLSGKPLAETEEEAPAVAAKDGKESEASSDEGGHTVAEALSPPGIPEDIGEGLKVKFLRENEELQARAEVKRSSVSIFSTVDNVSRTYSSGEDEKAKVAETEAESASEAPVTVVFAANGTVDPPHKIWIYGDGSEPDSGFCIEVDRFGEPRCLTKEDR